MIFWTGCWDVLALSDAALDQWRDRGVGGFVCKLNYLRNLGGSAEFTADGTNPLKGTQYDLQRAMRDTNIVGRAAARGIKLWLGVGLSSYWNAQTPLVEWFDDAGWSNSVVPKMADLAGAARLLGFSGLAFDEEPYPGQAGTPGTWNWNYPGNTHSETEVRAMVRARGAQLMQGLVSAYPGLEIIDYWTYFTDGWEALVQKVINGIPDANASKVQIDFWDGMTSIPGYGPIRFADGIFTKTSHLYKSTWDSAFTYDFNRVYALLSHRLTNWSYASSRVSLTPFAWINSGPGSFEADASTELCRGSARGISALGHRRSIRELRLWLAERL